MSTIDNDDAKDPQGTETGSGSERSIDEPVQQSDNVASESDQRGSGSPSRSGRTAIVVLLILVAAGGAYAFRDRLFGMGKTEEDAGERKVLYWVDPMHPAYTSDKPGTAPDCGMDLVPVYADGGASNSTLPPGVIEISAQKQQLIGVRLGDVTSERVSRSIRAVGRLAYDETKVTKVHAKYDGWVERVHVDSVGKLVGVGEPLVDIYSPEIHQTQEELLLARRARQELAGSGVAGVPESGDLLYRAARRRLELFDFKAEEIDAIEKRGTASRTITLHAQATGFVTARNAFLKQRVTSETELYALTDLSTVWIIADVYEYESAQVRVGQPATVTLAAFPGRSFRGKVSYIYPELNADTRTLKVRIDLPNPRFELKPDMYADVEIAVDSGEQLLVPEEAVMRSGLKDRVFVALEGGYFEPREVTIGERFEGKYVVLAGLAAGERVVTSGNFLVDSESQLKSAAAAMGGPHAGHGGAPAGGEAPAADRSNQTPAPDPAPVDHSKTDHSSSGAKPSAAPPKEPVEGKWTCSMHPSYISDQPGKCPYCGMNLEPVRTGKSKSPKRK